MALLPSDCHPERSAAVRAANRGAKSRDLFFVRRLVLREGIAQHVNG
jgi:hypothetical protein